MNEKLKNFLFLAMQRGGNISPQMRQQAQSGNLPMMQMGNDIQKMNQRQAAHYGYFQAGGEQEQIDQQYLSPMTSYSQRVSDFLRNLKEQAMGAVQDEMVQTNDAYAEEADAITGMPMAQYGAQYNQPGIDAAKAWEAMSKNRTNTMEPLIGAASLATGLKGYFGDDAAFAANPYNETYLKKVKYKNIKGTEPVIPIEQPVNPQLSQTQTMQSGGQYDVWRKGLGLPSQGEQPTGGRYDDIYNWTNNDYGSTANGSSGTNWGNVFMSGIPGVPGSNNQPATFEKGTGQSFTLPENRTTGSATQEKPKTEDKPKVETKPKPEVKTKTEETKTTDGTSTSTPTTEEEKKKKEEAEKAKTETTTTGTETKTETKPEAKTETTTEKEKKTVGDGYDYLRALADPNSMQAGAIYTTDKKGNQVPMAFYDPNLRVISTTADYRNTLGNLFRGEDKKKRGSLKSFTVRYGTLDDGTPVALDDQGNVIQQPITQSPNVNDLSGAKEVTGLKPNPAFDLAWPTGRQMPTYPGSQPAVTAPGSTKTGSTISMDDLVPGGVQVGPQSAPPSVVPSVVPQNAATVPLDLSNYMPALQYLDPNSPMRQSLQQQGMQQAYQNGALINTPPVSSQNAQSYSPKLLESNPPGSIVQGEDGNFYFKDANGQIHSSNNQNSLTQKRNSMGLTGKKHGGSLNKFMRQYAGGGPGTTPAVNMLNFADESDQLLADQGPIDPDTGLPIESSLDKPMTDAERMKVFDDAYNFPGAIPKPAKKDNRFFKDIKEAKYKFKDYNPFLAPAMMAGLDTLAGVAQNRDAAQKEKELRGRLAFDQIGFKTPQTSGSQGDWTFNEGYMRPNDMVPVQFTGAGPLAQMGGSLNEGDELYLDDETINAILAAGGQIEYLD